MAKTVRFGRYLLERRLAVGGMAEVFLGRIEGPQGFQKRVVVKRILPHLQNDENYIKMFLDEARLAARFNHPNLIQVYELARIENQYCLAMEYIEGEDVASILDESMRFGRQVPIDIAAYIIASAAEGLDYVHELTTETGEPLNVVHRDISPANVIVTWRGGVKIVDFGIAKHEIATTHTATGTLKGKFSYMSPEQARGEPVDRRSDIFSLGTILYELLTVTPCFAGSNQLEILDAVIDVRYRPLREIRRDVPPEIDRILSRMLTKRAYRFPVANDVRLSLRRFMADTNMPTAADVGMFMTGLFGRPPREVPDRVPTAIQGFDEVLVTDEFSSPALAANAGAYHMMIESQRIASSSTSEPSIPEGRAANSGERSINVEPFDIPLVAHEQNGEPASTFARVADRLREPRYWPTTLLIIATAMVLSAVVLVMVYRASLGMPWKPHELFSELLESSPPPPSPSEVVGEGSLEVLTEPPGALVTIEGHTFTERTPMSVNNLPIGVPQMLVVQLGGYEKVARKVTLSGSGLQTVLLNLRRRKGVATATLEVSTQPPGAVVVLDTRVTSHKTPATIQVDAGVEVAVTAQLRGYSARTVRLKPRAGETHVVAVSLSKPSVTRVGYLDLESEPRADATIGGRRVGSTPIRHYRLAAGPVVIQLRNTKLGLSKTLRLNIGAGETLRRRVVFRKGQVAFDVRPWADVYLGGRKLGTTPFPPISLYEGTYAVKLVNRDLGVERVVQVSVKSGKLRKVFEQLR